MVEDNPYPSPKTDIGDERERADKESTPLANGDNPYLRPLFGCRKYALVAFAMMILSGPVAESAIRAVWSLRSAVPASVLHGVSSCAALLVFLSSLVFAASTLGCWSFLFMTGQRHAGVNYALGHLLLSILLTPILLVGIVVVPLQVRGDVERSSEPQNVAE